MPVYSVEGKLGTGKTKFCVWVAQQALRDGRRVATNLDLQLEHLLPRKACEYVRIPDKPTAADLEAAGHGNAGSYDEDRNGVLILDELGTWLNSRAFQDKSRAPLIDWLIHARKHGWDVYLICQDAGMIDRQVREALIEYDCRCMRMDKVRIPLLGVVLRALGDVLGALLPGVGRGLKVKRWGYLPRMHLVTARVGQGQNKVVAERWFYRGDDLHQAYDTRQVFRADYAEPTKTVRYVPPAAVEPAWLGALRRAWAGPARPVLKPKLPGLEAAAAVCRDGAWRLARDLAGGR